MRRNFRLGRQLRPREVVVRLVHHYYASTAASANELSDLVASKLVRKRHFCWLHLRALWEA